MWSPRFDKRRPQRLLEEPPNVTRKMRGLDSGANARSDDREALGFFDTAGAAILPSATKCARRKRDQRVGLRGRKRRRAEHLNEDRRVGIGACRSASDTVPAAPSHPQGRRRQPVPEAVTRGELRR
jgi:hypothetical protein